jgi:hypothetical protein
MLYYLNNCQNIDHPALYHGNAFFDLWVTGRDDAIAQELRPGDTCIVACYAGAGRNEKRRVVFATYEFKGIRRVASPDSPARTIWVLDGNLVRSEELPKQDAAQHSLYSRFFNKRGHFKQASVLRGT